MPSPFCIPSWRSHSRMPSPAAPEPRRSPVNLLPDDSSPTRQGFPILPLGM